MLVEEVVDTTRRALDVTAMNYVVLYADETPERDIWAEASQFPLIPGANRLILVRHAQKLKDWGQLARWLSGTRQLPRVYLVFVSDEHDTHTPGSRTLLPHLELFKAPRGSLVRCTQPAEDEAVAWVRRRARLDHDTAKHLLTRTGGDLSACAHVCSKLSLFDGRAGTSTIDLLVAETPAADFSDLLIAGDRRRALLCIPDLPHEHNKLIALLDSRLDLLQTLHRVQIAGRSWRDATGVNPYLARNYLPHARNYDPKSCAYRRRVLAVIDDALRSGARVGVFEALVALW